MHHKNKRFPFTERENFIIRESVNRLGEDWDTIARKLPGRTPKQIHDRYINYLRQGLKVGPWTKEEDEILIRMYNAIGSKWSKMMVKLPGRSGNDIKNRWHKHLMKYTIENDQKKEKPKESFLDNNYQTSDNNFISNKNDSDISQNIESKDIIEKSTSKNLSDGTFHQSMDNEDENKFFLDGKNVNFQQQIQFDLQNFDFVKSFEENVMKNNHMQHACQRDNMNSNQNQCEIKLINKIDINGNSLKMNNNGLNSNKMTNLGSSIFNLDYEVQEYLEGFNFQKIDFPWI